jgi:tetratricopeptide (TPR) repeat protein
MRGDTADALVRLNGCGAEAELVALARDCLAVGPENRPRNAGLVAKRITAYTAGVQERVQAAERERAVAVAKAIEERWRRKVQLALAASILALTTLGGLSTTYYLQQRAAQVAAGERVVDQVTTLQGQALAQPEEIQRWEVALAAVEQANPAGDPKTKARLVVLQKDIQAGLEAARRDKALLEKLVDIRSSEADLQNGADAAYARAFREAGIDIENLAPAQAGAKIKAGPPSVALALAAALDAWALIREGNLAGAAGAARLREAARVADPDPERIALRNALDQADKAARLTALQKMEKSAKIEELGPISLHLLGIGLAHAGDGALAESVLRRAQQRYPDDVGLSYILASVLENRGRSDEAVRYYMAARAVRPETAHALAHLLENRGESAEALAVFRDLRRLRPGNAKNLACIATSLARNGSSDEAQNTLNAAIAACRAEIARYPDDALARCNLGFLLGQRGLRDAAIAEARAALRLNPDLHQAHLLLGSALYFQGKPDQAIAELREVVRLQPGLAATHLNLGKMLQDQGKAAEASAAYREAIRLRPDLVEAHYRLGNSLMVQAKLDEANPEYRATIRLKPDHAEAYCELGGVLEHEGDYAGALAMLRKGHELGTRRSDWRHPSAQWVAAAERKLTLANRLPAILRGEEKPSGNGERLSFAELAYNGKHYATAVRLLAEALESDPKLGDDRQAAHRYSAACDAALAAAGKGKDEPPADDAAKVKLRRQALDWLRAELTAWSQLLKSAGHQFRPKFAGTLRHWKQDPDLAGIRDDEAVARLPDAERKGWQALWADVDSLWKRSTTPDATETKPSPPGPGR